MAGKRKRQGAVTTGEQTAHGPDRTTNSQTRIFSFGTIGKVHDRIDHPKKRKTAHLREPTPPLKVIPVAKLASQPERKRKRNPDADEDKSIKTDVLSTPRTKRVKNVLPPSPTGTPSKKAAALFDKLRIELRPENLPSTGFGQRLSYETPPDTPDGELESPESCLPRELRELEELYSCFLRALSIYYAHNGTSSPAKVGALLPFITKNWNKRDVTLDDLRLLLAIDSQSEQGFLLEDYGRAGICLTRRQARGRALKRAASYIDEASLCDSFTRDLSERWRNWCATSSTDDCTAGTFLGLFQLPEIAKNESVTKAAPLFVRGEQRLADLRASQAASVAKSKSAVPTLREGGPIPQAPQSRSTALLDRILAKQSLASTLPAAPTKTQLERNAALHRIEDVARVLALMVGGRERSSYSMPTATSQLQQSLRNPISREEVERCLELMATEIVPGFVKIVQSGEVKGLLVVKNGIVGVAELRSRVQRAVADH